MALSALFLKVFCPGIILTLMSLASLLLPAVDYSTRISIPVSSIIGFIFMHEEAKKLGGNCRYWIMVNTLFIVAVIIELMYVGPKYKFRSINGDEEKVDRYQFEQILLSVSRSKLDRRCLILFSIAYLIFLILWFSLLHI